MRDVPGRYRLSCPHEARDMERDGTPERFCASRCRDSMSALVSACSPSRRGFIRLALAGSSLPFMPSLGLGSGLANDRTRWYRDAKFGMFIHWGPYSLASEASVEASWPIITPTPAGISEAEYRELPRRFDPSKFDRMLSLILLGPQDRNTWCSRRNTTMVFACSTLPVDRAVDEIRPGRFDLVRRFASPGEIRRQPLP